MRDHWRILLGQLGHKDGQKIIDIGGAYDPVPIADEVVDIVNLGRGGKHYTLLDITYQPLPFPDKYFDIAICSQTLEDISSPALAMVEMSRVARRGIIEIPHRGAESVKQPKKDGAWCFGLSHHKWLIEKRTTLAKGGVPNEFLFFVPKIQLRLMRWPIPKWTGPLNIQYQWADEICFEMFYDNHDHGIMHDEANNDFARFREENRKYWCSDAAGLK